MTRVYGLPNGEVANIPAAIESGTRFRMEQDQAQEKKRLANTIWLAGATKYALDNNAAPEIMGPLFEEGKRRGVIGMDADPGAATREGLMKTYQGAVAQLGGLTEKKTDDIKEYEYYRRGEIQAGRPPLPLTDWMIKIKTAGRPQTDIHNYPSPPKDYVYKYEDPSNPQRPTSAEVIPGSEAAMEIEQRRAKEEGKDYMKQQGGVIVVDDIDRIFAAASPLNASGEKELWSKDIGPLSAIPAKMPIFGSATEAGQISDLLFGVKSRIGFDELQNMRDNSPTGGALGQVSTFEVEQLQSLMGKLNPTGDPGKFLYDLARVRNRFQEVIHGRGNYDAWLAPQAAYQLLMDHADDPLYRRDFKAKFGYLPPGFPDPGGE